MKNKCNLVVFTLLIICFNAKVVYAKPDASMSVSSSYIVSGQSVTANLTVSNFTTAQITISSAGNTNGCGYDDIIQTDTGSNITRTVSVTCKSNDVGIITFFYTVNALDSGYESNEISGEKSVTVGAPRELDSNNNLGSLGVEGYKITPEFSADTLDYSVEVPSTVNDVNITGSPASGYASISGTGKKEVNDGANLFVITVTSETGVPKEYKLTVNVKDDNPIKVSLGETEFTVMKNAKNIVKPELYEQTTIKINNIDIPAFYNETTNITLVGIKDSKGNVRLAIYDKENNSYELYEENKSDQMILLIRPIKDVKEGYIKSTVKIDDEEYECLKVNEESEYAIIYATNLITGEDDYYLYDSKENSYVRYSEEQLEPLKKELNKYKDVVKYLVIGLGVLGLLLIISLITRPRKNKEDKVKEKKNKKEKIPEEEIIVKEPEELKEEKKTSKKKTEVKEEEKVPEEKVVKKSKKQSQKDAIKSVEEATMIIENFEKKVREKELEKQKEEQEETMYDIFEDDRKRKKRK